ncbi:hypothetical protein [Aquabacterium sp. OR-4]|nr:hypothetical protein [Aquabacterium sp. OR-4]MDT7836950.1 hypothetical protein [Aquabacterium sp. OR-4]
MTFLTAALRALFGCVASAPAPAPAPPIDLELMQAILPCAVDGVRCYA